MVVMNLNTGMIFVSASKCYVYLLCLGASLALCLNCVLIVCLKCESGSRLFQPQGDCKMFTNLRLFPAVNSIAGTDWPIMEAFSQHKSIVKLTVERRGSE